MLLGFFSPVNDSGSICRSLFVAVKKKNPLAPRVITNGEFILSYKREADEVITENSEQAAGQASEEE